MRRSAWFTLLLLFLPGCISGPDHAEQLTADRQKCSNFGFQDGTDSFANCVMKLSMKREREQPPDHDTLVKRYSALSLKRRGDDRYPVCGAAEMDNELDTSMNKWVGPNCQMAPD
jgi:hypothetical protein